MARPKINRRESTALINSLTAGVVPRIGLRHIAVGRKREVDAFLRDLSAVEDGSAAFRLIAGDYGSGKSFLLQLIRNNAMERNFVVADADLSPERRLTGTKGQGLATYRELMNNLATTTRPGGGALESLLQQWIQNIQSTLVAEYNFPSDSFPLISMVRAKIDETLAELSEMTFGYTFSKVLEYYWTSIKNNNDQLKYECLKWLKGEFATRTDAKKSLGIDIIIEDNNWYEFLKLFAMFVYKAGYKGLLVFVDEGVNLYKISHRHARESNYEKLLTIYNDTMQGKAEYIGMFFSGTPQFINDRERGLYSYEALRSRIAESKYATAGYYDSTSPIIRLQQLTPEELFVLLERLKNLHQIHNNYESSIKQQQMTQFLNTNLSRLGAKSFLTPRHITRDFLSILNILHQNPEATFEEILQEKQSTPVLQEPNPEALDPNDNSYADFEV